MTTFRVHLTDTVTGQFQVHHVNACHASEIRALFSVIRPHFQIHHIDR